MKSECTVSRSGLNKSTSPHFLTADMKIVECVCFVGDAFARELYEVSVKEDTQSTFTVPRGNLKHHSNEQSQQLYSTAFICFFQMAVKDKKQEKNRKHVNVNTCIKQCLGL